MTESESLSETLRFLSEKETMRNVRVSMSVITHLRPKPLDLLHTVSFPKRYTIR
jgi:hypothetical protein